MVLQCNEGGDLQQIIQLSYAQPLQLIFSLFLLDLNFFRLGVLDRGLFTGSQQ